MQTIKELFHRMRTEPIPLVVRVQMSGDGFTAIRDDEAVETIKWPEIELIYGYKTDCFVFDKIWLAFELPGRQVQVGEDTDGFDNLMSAMNESLPGINLKWYSEIQLPPFAENLTVLYRRRAES